MSVECSKGIIENHPLKAFEGLVAVGERPLRVS